MILIVLQETNLLDPEAIDDAQHMKMVENKAKAVSGDVINVSPSISGFQLMLYLGFTSS